MVLEAWSVSLTWQGVTAGGPALTRAIAVTHFCLSFKAQSKYLSEASAKYQTGHLSSVEHPELVAPDRAVSTVSPGTELGMRLPFILARPQAHEGGEAGSGAEEASVSVLYDYRLYSKVMFCRVFIVVIRTGSVAK